MFKSIKYQNPEGTIIAAERDDGSVKIIEANEPDLFEAVKSGTLGAVANYVAPPEPTKTELLAHERAAMRCSPAQVRLALLRAGLLKDAEAIVAADPEAQIVWEYATVINRSSPLIEAMRGGKFTQAKIDEIFRAAMLITH